MPTGMRTAVTCAPHMRMRTAVTDISHQVFFLASFVGVTPAVLLDACAACRRALAHCPAPVRLFASGRWLLHVHALPAPAA